jgi:F0F1-type ATP synthase membrane subunit b/b'
MATVLVNLNVDFRLPEDVVQRARLDGLLTGEKIAELIMAEIDRRREAAAARLVTISEQLQANFRAEYGDLTDDEAQALIDQWIEEADEQSPHKDNASST